MSGLRNRLLVTVVSAVAVALAIATIAFNLVLSHSLSSDANDRLRARATAQLAVLETGGGRLALGETPDAAAVDSQVWVFSETSMLEAPPAPEPVERAARSLAGGPRRMLEVQGIDTRLYATPVVANGRRLGTVVAGISLEPYEHTKRVALIASLSLAGALLLLVAAAAHWLLGAALRPVTRMTEQAAEWSERDLDRRFGLGEPRDELTRLAATLDGLLDRLAAGLRREQRLSAELSHELRTPLSKVIAETELALRRNRAPEEYRGALEVVLRNAQQLVRTIDTLLAAAQQEAGILRGTADAAVSAENAAHACAELAGERGVDIVLEQPPAPLRVGVDGELVERILQPVLENACRYTRSRVHIAVRREGGNVTFDVSDDGPGVSAPERETIFDPGVRGSASGGNGTGAGLGLALSRRLARSASGEVEAQADAGGGRFVVRLPAG